MNILDLQKELSKQVESLHKELNDYLYPLGCFAVITNKTNGFDFNIVSESGEHLGSFTNFDKSSQENKFKDEYYYHCKVILDSYSSI